MSHPETVPVEQVDREAAADRLHGGRSAIGVSEAHTIQMLRDGRMDHHPWVVAFARHRIAALQAAAGRERVLREALRHAADNLDSAGFPASASLARQALVGESA